ncbi:sodium- and chloride-dependent neutral and basic amino acid transporter B(0+) [Arapaima gigas]
MFMRSCEVELGGQLRVTVREQNDGCEESKTRTGVPEENADRGNWTTKREYILSMVGYAVGLGNVWRFPYLAYKNGGGAFLIPYFLMLAVAGLPMFFLECSLGQFCSQGPINVWKAVPIMQGVGVTMVLVSTLVAVYYNVIVGYSIYYMFTSFQFPLPWSECFRWSDGNCSTTPTGTDHNDSCLAPNNISTAVKSPSEQYWDKVALRRTGGLEETGEIVWHLALCLLLAWLLTGAALFKGIKSSGKVVYFTATFPYVVLFILVVRGLTLDGARDGIEYYIGSQSNLTKLAEAEVWKDAVTQIFYSLSVAWGGLTALSSYNKFHNNCYKDSIIICAVNCGTSIFAGFAIFSILGHMAHVYGKPVSEVVQSDFALAFVAYPEALSQLPVSPLWSVLFFFMLLTLGLDSQFAGIETITTSLQDSFPEALKSRSSLLTVVTCIVLFLLGLPCVTQTGIYWVKLMDHFCAGWMLLITAVLELIGIIYIYGGSRFIKDIEMMIGPKNLLFWLWWKACWYLISPIVLAVILVWSLFTFTPPTYDSVVYPEWGVSLGWCMTAFCLMWIPAFAVWKLAKAEGSFWQRCKAASLATNSWGPYLDCHRGDRYKKQQSSGLDMKVTSNVYSINSNLTPV